MGLDNVIEVSWWVCFGGAVAFLFAASCAPQTAADCESACAPYVVLRTSPISCDCSSIRLQDGGEAVR